VWDEDEDEDEDDDDDDADAGCDSETESESQKKLKHLYVSRNFYICSYLINRIYIHKMSVGLPVRPSIFSGIRPLATAPKSTKAPILGFTWTTLAS
jgi:hypothetical protein